MIGKTIGQYQVIDKIGEGGMGAVYKAEDTTLHRLVALKTISRHLSEKPEAKERFVREAQAASSLNHPGITTVYEFLEEDDQQIICMEYVEGKTIRDMVESGRISVKKAIDIIMQAAEALEAAHNKGILHRDIKSANIMVTMEGRVKVMDFGLAQLEKGTTITRSGTTLGTLSYSSPEQISGHGIDRRSEIFSLGVVLYELLTGQLPFRSSSEAELIFSIINNEPEKVSKLCEDVTEALETLVIRILEKDPNLRVQSCRDLVTALQNIRKEMETTAVPIAPSELLHPTPHLPSIAVLPFTSMVTGEENEYFSDGMTEEIINALTKIEGLRVVARTSSFVFKDKTEDMREIGKQLNVETLLEGSVRKAGNRLRITAQLINVSDGFHIWSDRYDREMEDVFAIQDEISRAIVDALKVKLLGDEEAPLVKESTDNLEAYNLYLKGRYFLNKRTGNDMEKAIECFTEALQHDPKYALAYSGISDAFSCLGFYRFHPSRQAYYKAKETALKALELDEQLAESHAALGDTILFFDCDPSGAEREFLRAIEINPSYAYAYQEYAECLTAAGRHAEAIEAITKARDLDPLSLIINSDIGVMHYYARQYDKAIEQLQKIIEMDPNFNVARSWLTFAFVANEMFDQAIDEGKKAVKISNRSPVSLASLAYANATAGKTEEALSILEEIKGFSKDEYISSSDLAIVYAGLGDWDEAISWLEKAYDEHSHLLVYLKVSPIFENLHADPRFIDLLKKIGLE